MIYFAQPRGGGPVKIGTAVDVDRRIAQLEAYYGQPLVLLAVRPGGRDEEQAIHERFSEIRLGRTEQFRPTPQLMAFIGRPLLVCANPDVVEAIKPRVVVAVVVIKGSEEWKDWLEGAAEHCRTTVSAFLDLAAAEYAKVRGYKKETPKR